MPQLFVDHRTEDIHVNSIFLFSKAVRGLQIITYTRPLDEEEASQEKSAYDFLPRPWRLDKYQALNFTDQEIQFGASR